MAEKTIKKPHLIVNKLLQLVAAHHTATSIKTQCKQKYINMTATLHINKEFYVVLQTSGQSSLTQKTAK